MSQDNSRVLETPLMHEKVAQTNKPAVNEHFQPAYYV
jgi:hypothetical protein